MNHQQIVEALTLTDENIKEFQEIYEERLADWQGVYSIITASFDNYDSNLGAGSIRSRPLYEKLACIARYALLNGYVAALHDVQEVQQLGLAQK